MKKSACSHRFDSADTRNVTLKVLHFHDELSRNAVRRQLLCGIELLSVFFGSDLKISQKFLLPLVSIIVLLSRLPFLSAGYGNDWDNWRVANTARTIATTGEYSWSRVPGHPLQEIAFSVFWTGGPFALNGITAIFSALAVVYFALSLKLIGCKDHVLASLALGFTPIMFLNSVNSEDYLLALAFILASLYYVFTHRPLVAGTLLGAAVGCRVTSGAMLIPLCLLLYQPEAGRRNLVILSKFGIATGLTSLALYLPVLLKYGLDFFEHSETPHVPLIGIVKLATLDVWGTIGVLALLVGMTSMIFLPNQSRGATSVPEEVCGRHILAWIIAILLNTTIYLVYVFNYKAAYLIPTIPFVILLLGRILNRRVFVFVCVALLFSPFLFGVITKSSMDTFGGSKFFALSGYALRFDILGDQVFVDPLNGPVLIDQSRRVRSTEYISQVLSHASSLSDKTLVVTGRWLLMIDAYLATESQGTVDYVGYVGELALRQYTAQGFKLYYLEGVREYDFNGSHIDLRKLGAMPFISDE